MKRILTVSVCLFALTACETLPDVSMPSMPSFDWFESNDVEEQPVTKVDIDGADSQQDKPKELLPIISENKDSSSLMTEMEEMEKLTGSALRFDNRGNETNFIEETMIEETVVTLDEADLPITQEKVDLVNEEIEETLKAENVVQPEPVKDAAPVVSKPVEKEIIAVKEEKTADVLVHDIVPAAPLVSEKQDAKKVETVNKAPVEESLNIKSVQEVAEVSPHPVSEVMTEEVSMFTESDFKLSTAKGCPKVEIMPAGRSITYFENEMSGAMVARAVINEIKGGCEVVSGGLEIDFDILMHGKITDRGRFEGKKDQEAFMTFPYFVAVMTPQGLPVDKKIMATAMRFKPIVNDLSHAEKITQFIPMNNVAEAENYTITVGFQLNRKQLEYNRARNINRVDNLRVAPDLKRNPSRLSVNPLKD